MRTIAIALMVLAVAGAAVAGQNPYVRAFVSFDPDCDTGPYVHRTEAVSGLDEQQNRRHNVSCSTRRL